MSGQFAIFVGHIKNSRKGVTCSKCQGNVCTNHSQQKVNCKKRNKDFNKYDKDKDEYNSGTFNLEFFPLPFDIC